MVGQGFQKKGWQVLLLVWLGFGPWFGGVVVASVSDLRGQIQANQARHASLVSRYEEERQRVKVLAERLEVLKQEAERGGLFALPARLRLSSLRSQAQTLAKTAEAIETQLRQEEAEGQRLRGLLQEALRKNLRSIRQALKSAQGTERKRLAENEKELRQEIASLAKLSPAKTAKEVQPWTIRLHPLDGPQEIRQKADAIKDMEDRVAARLQALQKRLVRTERQVHRTKSDRQLEKQVSEMTSDEELFDEQDRNPRVVAGAREQGTKIATAEDQRVFAGTTAPPQAAPPARSESATKSGTTNQASPTAPSLQSDPSSTKAPGAASTSPAADSFQAGAPTVQATSPRVGLLPTPHLSSKNLDPMNPAGTAEQQLEALKRYRAELQEKLNNLRKQHSDFLKKAKQIEAQERRRDRR